MPAGKVLVAGLMCFLLWTLLEAASLERSTEAARLGARRSAALAVLHPLATLSRATGLDRVRQAVDLALGHQGDLPSGAAPPPAEAATLPSPPVSTIPAGAPTASSSPTPLPFVPPLRVPTLGDPLRLLVLGDSLARDLGNGLARTLGASGSYDVSIDARISTGLARRDYFDWPARLRSDLSRLDPDIVVVMLGANDPQDFFLGGSRMVVGTPQWSAAYRGRAGRFMDQVLRDGRALVWVGMPAMRSDRLSGWMRVMNRMYRAEAATRPSVTYVDPWPLSTDGARRYSAYLPDASGHESLVREPDGVHFTAAGSDRLARVVAERLLAAWSLPA